MLRRSLVAAGLTLALAATAGPVYAAWQSNGTGTAKATATSLGAASQGAGGNATATSLDLSWTSPTNPAPTNFAITRDGSAITCDFNASGLGTAKCRDTFTASSTARTFAYVVTPMLGAWSGGSVSFSASPVTATALTVSLTSSVATGGKTATTWDATVTATATSGGSAANGVTIGYSWSDGHTGSCVTSGNGKCSGSDNGIPNTTTSVSFTVTATTKTGTTYVTTYTPSNPLAVNRQ